MGQHYFLCDYAIRLVEILRRLLESKYGDNERFIFSAEDVRGIDSFWEDRVFSKLNVNLWFRGYQHSHFKGSIYCWNRLAWLPNRSCTVETTRNWQHTANWIVVTYTHKHRGRVGSYPREIPGCNMGSVNTATIPGEPSCFIIHTVLEALRRSLPSANVSEKFAKRRLQLFEIDLEVLYGASVTPDIPEALSRLNTDGLTKQSSIKIYLYSWSMRLRNSKMPRKNISTKAKHRTDEPVAT